MFIGSNYVRTDAAKDQTTLGWEHIKIMERVLYRTRTLPSVTYYHYMLLCVVDHDDFAEIIPEKLQSEIISGYYQFYGSK